MGATAMLNAWDQGYIIKEKKKEKKKRKKKPGYVLVNWLQLLPLLSSVGRDWRQLQGGAQQLPGDHGSLQ